MKDLTAGIDQDKQRKDQEELYIEPCARKDQQQYKRKQHRQHN